MFQLPILKCCEETLLIIMNNFDNSVSMIEENTYVNTTQTI